MTTSITEPLSLETVIADYSQYGLRIALASAPDASVEALFQKSFLAPPPDFPIHVVMRHEDALLSYIHFTEYSGALLGGGACVDKAALKRIPAHARRFLRDARGAYFLSLTQSIAHFRHTHRAVFGYCGDALACRIDLQAGLVQTPYQHLLVVWMAESRAQERELLITRVNALGPF